jgi:dihydrofolate synthase/folylpolyglutamate synthase
LFNLPKYGDGVCLARLAALLEALSIDRALLQRRAVVVTGSNGKGSTAAFCAGIGRAFGLRTGLFTSPHLVHFNERFQIDATPIDDAVLARLVSQVETAITELSRQRQNKCQDRFGAFEAGFALACRYFQEAECDFAVFEAGIGGRYDPVRLVGARSTSVTSVDFEHVELLGNSLALICSDKSDACACGGSIVYGENLQELRPHILEYNRNRNVTSLFVRDQVGISNEEVCAAGQRFDFRFADHDFRSLEPSLPGLFQFNNAAIAAAQFLLWLQQARPEAPSAAIEAAVRNGLRDTSWPGRIEIIRQNPLTIIDVGHTPDGVRQALASLRAIHGNGGWILVLGISRDKNIDEIARALAPAFDTIVCTAAHHKGADAQRVAAAARKANATAILHSAPRIEDAVSVSTTLAQSSGRKIYVAGGLFVAVEYATVTRGERAEDLEFF